MSDTLTMQTMLDAMDRLKRLTDEVTGVRDVFVSDYLPKLEKPVCHIRLAHPLIVWLAKWLPMSPWVWLEGVEEEDQAYIIQGRMYISSRAYAALRARQ